jgi:hypothetical protein
MRPEAAAAYVRDAVVAREPLVHERVVGVEEVRDAAVLVTIVSNRSSVSRLNE